MASRVVCACVSKKTKSWIEVPVTGQVRAALDAHLIAVITGHDIDEIQRILKTCMPRTTGRAARAIALPSVRAPREANQNPANKTAGLGDYWTVFLGDIVLNQ